MASVLKITSLDFRATPGDVRRVFKENGVRPADIHIGFFDNGKPNGTAFVVLKDKRDTDLALEVDGAYCRDSRLIVKSSSLKEFNRAFPGKPATTKKDKPIEHVNKGSDKPDKDEKYIGVIRIENLEYSTTPSDIRKFFKENEARPADIHLVLDQSGSKHNGSAFLVFNNPGERTNALKLSGVNFREKRLVVKPASPKDFDRYFPGVPMVSKPPSGGARGRGGRGAARGGAGMRGTTREDERPQGRFQDSGRGRGSGMRGGRGGRGAGRGGRGGRGGGGVGRESAPARESRYGEDSFYSNSGRDRSRSPISRGRKDTNGDLSQDRRKSDVGRTVAKPSANLSSRFEEPIGAINERKFLRISGLPYNASQVDIQEYFRPILTRDIYIMRNVSGKYAGKFNGNAIVEFFSEGDARQALKMDGSKFGHQSITVVRATKDEIMRTIEENKFSTDGASTSQAGPDLSAMTAIAQSNPQVQHLLNLLTATVNTIAGAAAAAVNPPKSERREERSGRGDRSRDDPVINRVASSANINVNDIKLGRVVGLRNLPYSITPEEILQFFRSYKVIPDSVRIHYLDDGRCSGDAIVCFRGNREARNAVTDLNKGTIGRRKVELFFL